MAAAKEGGKDNESLVSVPSGELDRAVARYMQEHSEFFAIVAEQYAGPLPHPNHLKQFEAVHPGAADRIIRMAEQQLAHRQEVESRVVRSSLKLEAKGQWFAFGITLAIVGGGFYVISQGYSIGGLVPMIGAIATLAGLFIYGKRKNQKNQSGSADGIGQRDFQPDIPKLGSHSEQRGES
ncbi:MAG: DUF2335 domain-containing protein [Gammaproteobacteria bacterium]|nr:DUF2335 domain-containing protein [Gammaproteobacteria bacterium]